MVKSVFWISIIVIIYTYIGYPAIVWLLAGLKSRRVSRAEITPRVSIVLACHNEAKSIEARIENLLTLDYPEEMLEVIVVSDGSTDRTAEVARSTPSDRVRVFSYEDRMGKATAINIGVEIASGEIVVFADARQRFDERALKEIVANFNDDTIGAVSGELIIDSRRGSSVGEGIGLYWRYEKWIRKNESRCNSVIGATGAIYAIRRELWDALPPMTILDDVYTPMRIALGGRRVVFEEKALAFDEPSETVSREFSRKVRTLTGNYQLCQLMPRLLLPNSSLIFQFHSHKLMRLLVPIFFLLLVATNLVIVAGPAPSLFYEATLAAQLAFYCSVLAGGFLLKKNHKARLLKFAYVFSVMNAAALVSLFYFILGKRNVWVRSE
ncbi:MAG TPA: glycosyltransferase family 2 protein [Blastocatellia bacterium]|nr:glycosyltransferase family 2 protein [Blastocatellia bacterium]